MLPRFHLLTDHRVLDQAALDRTVAAVAGAARGGVDAVQVRAKQHTDREVLAWTQALIAALRPAGTRVLVNDRVDVALAAGADGVHLGVDDLPVSAVRRLAGPQFLIGATCRHVGHAVRARAEGADYAGVGPVFATTSKAGLPDSLGCDVLAQAAQVLPCIAVGGVTAARVPQVLAAGAHGVAVIAAVWRATDPPAAAAEIAGLVRTA